MSIKAEYHIPVSEGAKTPVDWLAESSGLSRQKIKQAMKKGCVWLEKDGGIRRLRRAAKPLSKGAKELMLH